MNNNKNYFFWRPKDSNKYDYGHTLIVAGSPAYLGAAVLTAEAANRSGCGLVTLAVPARFYSTVRAMLRPEIILCPLTGREKIFGLARVNFLLDWIKKKRVNSVGIGPGLGDNPRTIKFVHRFLSAISIPAVVDADALRVFKIDRLVKFGAPLILTPHPGEIARIFGVGPQEIKNRRSYFCQRLARATGAIVVLKGYRSLISDGQRVLVNKSGGPGLARGGSGDVLTGLLAGLLARRNLNEKDILPIVVRAVYWHGLAGDIAARKNTETAMNVNDVIAALPEAAKILKRRWK
jgi:NAD(P)H-hydrate epimerase